MELHALPRGAQVEGSTFKDQPQRMGMDRAAPGIPLWLGSHGLSLADVTNTIDGVDDPVRVFHRTYETGNMSALADSMAAVRRQVSRCVDLAFNRFGCSACARSRSTKDVVGGKQTDPQGPGGL